MPLVRSSGLLSVAPALCLELRDVVASTPNGCHLQCAQALVSAGQRDCLLDGAGGIGYVAAVLLRYLPAAPRRARA
uniref:Uncharacterized protein n=1 Tax=Tanacetum cinerariifolium TaxID=118510 RepID=A0A699VPV3_TANCI|nr:hypothetical protein [Tanacetum cinerariifolium]